MRTRKIHIFASITFTTMILLLFLKHKLRYRQFWQLEDILSAKSKPKIDKTIFFVESSGYTHAYGWHSKFQDQIVHLSARQACAIESVAINNRKANIFVVYTFPGKYTIIRRDKLLAAVTAYRNVHFRSLDMLTFAQNHTIFEWLGSAKIFKTSYIATHISDLLRLLLLERYGGIYIDFDTITLQSFQNLNLNFAGAQDYIVTNGVLSFSHSGLGHMIVEKCINEFVNSYCGYTWACNGPIVITRVLKHLCNEKLDESCDYKVLSEHILSPIPWFRSPMIFEESETIHVLLRANESIVLHTFNHITKYIANKKHEMGAYGKLAQKHCPKVYNALSYEEDFSTV